MTIPARVQKASAYLHEHIGNIQEGTWGLVLGTGLGGVVAQMRETRRISYASIPGFPQSTVEGHAGCLVLGELAGRPLAVLSGRFHLYEGYPAAEACFGIRVLFELGVRTLVLTNAAGALNPLFEAGELMCIADHMNRTGQSPLTGRHEPLWGERFPDMNRVYDPTLRSLARRVSLNLGIRLHEGVYVQVAGPELETPAETRSYRAMGADAVGMSTAIEAVAAAQMGMRILGISCLTNKNLPDCMQSVPLAEVLAQAKAASGRMGRLLAGIIKESCWPADETEADSTG